MGGGATTLVADASKARGKAVSTVFAIGLSDEFGCLLVPVCPVEVATALEWGKCDVTGM